MTYYIITLLVDEFENTYQIEKTNIINSLDKAELLLYGQLILSSDRILHIETLSKEEKECA